MRHVVAFILLGLTALPAAVRAQQQAPLTFNAPYACPDGLTIVVQRCETRGRGEICLYERHRAGALLDRANSTRDQLGRRLQSCEPAQAVEPGSGQAMNPPYLSQMPPVERVMREVRGADALETAARQAGVLWQLRDVISEMALRQGRNDRQWTLDERRLFNQYHAAYYQAWQPVEQALAGNRPRLFELQGYTATRDLLYEALDRLAAPGFAAEFRKARGEIDARIQARKEADRRQMEAAQAEQQRALAELQASRQPRPWQRDLARCIAAGRSESQCLTEGLGKGFVEMAPIAKNKERPAGLTITGVYSGAGGFNVTFTPTSAAVTCKGVTGQASYAVQRRPTQVQIALRAPDVATVLPFGSALAEKLAPKDPTANPEQWQGQQIVLPVRPDGKLAATRLAPRPAATIEVTGPVPVGTRQGTRTITEWIGNVPTTRTVPTTETIYAAKTHTCLLGLLSPTGKMPLMGSMSTGVATALEVMSGNTDPGANVKVPPPGLRLHGKYVGQDGVDVEFHPESAVLGCRDAVSAREYTIAATGASVLVQIQDNARPIVLELKPDGTLAGPGPVQLNGRMWAGTDASGNPVFRPVSDTCNLAMLAAEGSARPATAAAAAAPSPVTAGGATAAAAPAPAAVATGSTGDAVLSVAAGLPSQPGVANPLAGRTFVLLNDSMETALTQVGVRPPAGTSAINTWMSSCAARQASCQQALAAAVEAHGVAIVQADGGGTAQFSAVPAGTYYLYGLALVNNQPVLWNLRMELKPGGNAVTLDQRNAASLN